MTVRSGGSYVADPKTGEEKLVERTDVRGTEEAATREDGGSDDAREPAQAARRKGPKPEE